VPAKLFRRRRAAGTGFVLGSRLDDCVRCLRTGGFLFDHFGYAVVWLGFLV
jgi:hypothetical protein